MPINTQEIIKEYQQSANDTGSTNVQIALLSTRIKHLTEHFKIHKKDHHSRRGLLKLVSQRKKLLTYLKSQSGEDYLSLIGKLGLRK